jgi:hypothetical protein
MVGVQDGRITPPAYRLSFCPIPEREWKGLFGMRLLLAVRVFFRILLDRAAAEAIGDLLVSDGGPEVARPSVEPPGAAAAPAVMRRGRSDALTLLATLQREARFLDFVQEPLEGFSDAQIGAAARDVHRDCGQVLQRLFAVEPATTEPEGAELEVAPGYDPGRWRLTGNVGGEPPFRGRLTHHGWRATKCELPAWSGSREAEQIVAPVEIEVN